ncbi:MAG: hypothetical protein AABX55_02545 [Nanoarchaeota archaeon]
MDTNQANKIVHEMLDLLDKCRLKLAKHKGGSGSFGNSEKYPKIEKNLEYAEDLIRSLTQF